jgi:hypothetical protein
MAVQRNVTHTFGVVSPEERQTRTVGSYDVREGNGKRTEPSNTLRGSLKQQVIVRQVANAAVNVKPVELNHVANQNTYVVIAKRNSHEGDKPNASSANAAAVTKVALAAI